MSITGWRAELRPRQRILFVLVQITGAIGGIGVFMNGVFPETSYAVHHAWAGVVFNGFAAALVMTPFALWRGDRVSAVIAGYCGLGLIAVILMFAFSGTHWVEWLPVSMFLAFPALLGWLMSGNGDPSSQTAVVSGGASAASTLSEI